MSRYIIVFLFSFAVFLSLLTPNVNSGDAGELVTASYYMGLAHPSGYPFYLLIGKLFTFLPFGNMAFRVALISALFSSINLMLVYWLTYRLTENEAASFFAAATLLVSYSYMTQSVIAKFYPLNLFIVLLIFSMWLHVYLDGFKEWALLITAFLFGLTMTNHHTGILMVIPVLFALLFYRRHLTLKLLATACFTAALGFILYSYAFIRAGSGSFFTTYNVYNFHDFYKLLTRGDYGEKNSISLALYMFSSVSKYWYAVKNFLSLITKSFSVYSYPLFFVGAYYLYKKYSRLLLFILISLFAYGPLLAKINTFFMENLSEKDYYLSGHQFYLPAFSFYALFLGIGLCQILLWLKQMRFTILSKAVPAIIIMLPMIFLISRATDSNYRTNYVPYQAIKDTFSILPVNSIILSYGDDAIFQGWYIKLIGRYREDICQSGAATIKERAWFYQSCKKEIYGDIYPEVFTGKVSKLVPLMMKNRFYGTDMIDSKFPYESYLYSKPFSLVHLYLPKRKTVEEMRLKGGDNTAAFNNNLMIAEKIVNPYPCLSHFTDDWLSRGICNRYITHYSELGRLYGDEKYGKTGKTVSVSYFGADEKLKELYTVKVTNKNLPYFSLATLIQEHNKWPLYYIRVK